jgi:hypothetical protein
MVRQTVLAILACALTTHDAVGQSVTSFDPPSGIVQVPATGPGAPAITIYNADPWDALLVDLPGLSSFLWVEVSAASGSCDADVSLPSSGPATVTVDADSTCILSAAVDPLAAPQPGQLVEEGVTLTSSGSAMLSASYTLRATGQRRWRRAGSRERPVRRRRGHLRAHHPPVRRGPDTPCFQS